MPIKVLNQTGYAIHRAVVQSHLTAYVQFHRYVANLTMNSTVNGSSESSSCFALLYSTASKIGVTVTYCLIFIVSLVANSLIVTIVYKTPNLKKPINYFIANMAFSDILSAIFWMPLNLSLVHTNSLLIGGQLGQALCKLVFFFGNVSLFVSIQNLILIAVDRFGAVVFPLRSPLSSLSLIAGDIVQSPGGTSCVMKWEKVFGESLSSASIVLAHGILQIHIPVLLSAIVYSIIITKL